MNTRLALFLSAAFAVSWSNEAPALIIDLAPPDSSFGPSYSQDGYTFTNSSGLLDSYVNVLASGFPSFNASNVNGDIVQNYGSTTNTLTNNAGLPFSFTSIGLADAFNGAFPPSGGDVVFTFNHVGGATDTTTVSLANGPGLQIFPFNETNLTSVVFEPTTTFDVLPDIGTVGPIVQFDDVGVAAAPELSTWTMLIIGFAGLGLFASRRKSKTTISPA
jgi:hypothetical protein